MTHDPGHDHDHGHAGEHGEPEGILPEEIDAGFVPKAAEDAAWVELDGEVVVAREVWGSIETHVLNQVGGIVWQCFDGTGTVDELAADLAEAFDAPVDVVREDVLTLARELGAAGLLDGVRVPPPPPPPEAGVPEGTAFPAFRLADLDGATVDLAERRGRRVLVVNWSSACGYCARIAPELAELEAPLAERAVDVVYLAADGAEQNRELAERSGVTAPVLPTGGATPEPFAGIGTPAAYLLDEEGRTVGPIAIGAVDVPARARALAGVSAEEDQAAG